MKSRTKQFGCMMLVFILFFLGMCQQTTKAHSFLTYLQHMEEADRIEKTQADCVYAGSGTARLISGLRDTFQNIRREQIRPNLRWNAESFRLEEMQKSFLVFTAISAVLLYRIKGRDITILDYIHKQDGEK